MPDQDLAPRRPLSVGDAITIIALLAFAIGWVAFTTWDADALVGEGGESKLDFWSGVLVVLVVASPAMWAGRLAAHIIKGGADA